MATSSSRRLLGLVAVSLLLWPVADTGWVYPAAAVVLGAGFLVEAHRMWGRARGTEDLSVIQPMRLFHASNLYLSLLFVSVALDPLLDGVGGAGHLVVAEAEVATEEAERVDQAGPLLLARTVAAAAPGSRRHEPGQEQGDG